MVQTIKISKGDYNVLIYPTSTNTQLDNKLFVITPPKSEGKQDEGVITPKVVDLLRITTTYRIQGHIVSTTRANAYTIKNTLVKICEGAEVQGGEISATVEPENTNIPECEYSKSEIKGYIEKLTITENSRDLSSDITYPDDTIWFDIDMTMVIGLRV